MQFLIDHGIDMTILDYRWERDGSGLAALRGERREDGSMAGAGRTATRTATMSSRSVRL